MKTVFLLPLLILCAALPAQKREYTDDAEVRAHFNLETKLSKKFSVHLDQQYRFGDNVGYLTRGSADFGLVYKLNRTVRLEGDYYYIQRRKNNGSYATRHWFSGAVVVRGDVNRLRFIYRNMVQFRNGDMYSTDENLTKIYDRNKLTMRYEATKRFTFYVSGEVYIPLNNPQMQGIERMRDAAGVLFKTFKNQQLELYFMYQQRFIKGGWWDQSDRYPSPYFQRDFIYGIGYSIEI
jgi:hypothetical protein